MRAEEQGLALGYGLFHEARIIGPECLLPVENRPRRIPADAEGRSPGRAQGRIVPVERRYPLRGQNQAGKAEQQHERQIQQAPIAGAFRGTKAEGIVLRGRRTNNDTP